MNKFVCKFIEDGTGIAKTNEDTKFNIQTQIRTETLNYQ